MQRDTKIIIVICIALFTIWMPVSFIWVYFFSKHIWLVTIVGFVLFFNISYFSLKLFGTKAMLKRKMRHESIEWNKIRHYFQ